MIFIQYRRWLATDGVYKFHDRHSQRRARNSPVAIFVSPQYRRFEDISSIIGRKWRSQSGRSRWHVSSFRVIVPTSRSIYSHSRVVCNFVPVAQLLFNWTSSFHELMSLEKEKLCCTDKFIFLFTFFIFMRFSLKILHLLKIEKRLNYKLPQLKFNNLWLL